MDCNTGADFCDCGSVLCVCPDYEADNDREENYIEGMNVRMEESE